MNLTNRDLTKRETEILFEIYEHVHQQHAAELATARSTANGARPDAGASIEEVAAARDAVDAADQLQVTMGMEAARLAFLAGQVDGFRMGVAYTAGVIDREPHRVVSIIQAMARTDYAVGLVAEASAQLEADLLTSNPRAHRTNDEVPDNTAVAAGITRWAGELEALINQRGNEEMKKALRELMKAVRTVLNGGAA